MNPAVRALVQRQLDRQERIRRLVLDAFEVVPGARVRKTEVAQVVADATGRIVSPNLVAEVTQAALGIAGVRPVRPANKSLFTGLRRRDRTAPG